MDEELTPAPEGHPEMDGEESDGGTQDEPPLLRCQTVPTEPPPRRHRPKLRVCLRCWQPIVPRAGRADLVGGFGHRRDCPDRGLDPAAGGLAGRWLYGEPGWAEPVVLCDPCGEAASAEFAEDENVLALPASAVDDRDWVQWLADNPATTCWWCGEELPEVRRG